jgi:hypothetical protein
MTNKRIFTAALLTALMSAPSAAAPASDNAGRLVTNSGKVEKKEAGSAGWIQAGPLDGLKAGTAVRTARGSAARILMSDNSVLVLGQGSEIEISEYSAAAGRAAALITIFSGKVVASTSRLPSGEVPRYELRTPAASAGVRAGYLIVEVSEDDGKSVFRLMDGKATVKSIIEEGQGAELLSGSSTTVTPGNLPFAPIQAQADAFTAAVHEIERPFTESVAARPDGKAAVSDALVVFAVPEKQQRSSGPDPFDAEQAAGSQTPPVQQVEFPPASGSAPVILKVNMPPSDTGAAHRLHD